MVGVSDKKSAFKTDTKLKEYYKIGNHIESDKLDEAVRLARSFADLEGMGLDSMGNILKSQCDKVCKKYNELYEGYEILSSICIACSILVMTTMMKSVYIDLDVEKGANVVPQLCEWSKLSIDFLKGAGGARGVSILKDQEFIDHIQLKVNQLKAATTNKQTHDYLDMKDKTIANLKTEYERIMTSQGGGSGSGDMKVDSDKVVYQTPETKQGDDDDDDDDDEQLLKEGEDEGLSKKRKLNRTRTVVGLTPGTESKISLFNNLLDDLDLVFPNDDDFLDVMMDFERTNDEIISELEYLPLVDFNEQRQQEFKSLETTGLEDLDEKDIEVIGLLNELIKEKSGLDTVEIVDNIESICICDDLIEETITGKIKKKDIKKKKAKTKKKKKNKKKRTRKKKTKRRKSRRKKTNKNKKDLVDEIINRLGY